MKMFSPHQTESNNKQQDSQLKQEMKSTTGSGSSNSPYKLAKSVSQQFVDDEQQFEETHEFLRRTKQQEEEAQQELERSRRKSKLSHQDKRKQQALLAKEETIELDELSSKSNSSSGNCCSSCCKMMSKIIITLVIIIVCLLAAIYCIPYIELDVGVPKPLPKIRLNYEEGPLQPSTASQFKVERLFHGQLYGPESIALDSFGNMYMAVEGGFILYAHLNKSSPIKKSYYDKNLFNQKVALPEQAYYSAIQASGLGVGGQQHELQVSDLPELVKIAELNGIKQMPYEHFHQKRRVRDGSGVWRRECQLDERIYGQTLSQLVNVDQVVPEGSGSSFNDIETSGKAGKRFVSNVIASRCSKPLGVRLSPDENYLYVIDTLSGLYKINLRNSDNNKPNLSSSQQQQQRSANKLIDFRQNKRQLLPIIRSDQLLSGDQAISRDFVNVSLMALDDLVIDFGAGSKGGDLIYMSDASQRWQAISFIFDLLEAKPTGVILRYDTGLNQLSVLDPTQVAHVRTSSLQITLQEEHDLPSRSSSNQSLYYGIGAPRLDENDVFDDRPLHFPNGLELTDDRQALLIADSSNRRIVKHYIRGPRRGTTDLWAWTPNYPDNIRRGADRKQETYWVAGCGESSSSRGFDPMAGVKELPTLRKFIIKLAYLYGWFVEQIGMYILQSATITDRGYGFKTGHFICQGSCTGMMLIQYNKNGDIIRSIHSKEFPKDLAYYSQVNEVFDQKTQEHILYLSSPAYAYVTKLVLPSDSQEIPPTGLGQR